MSRTPFRFIEISSDPEIINDIYNKMSGYQQLFVSNKAYRDWVDLYAQLYGPINKNNSFQYERHKGNMFYYNRLNRILNKTRYEPQSNVFNEFISSPYTEFIINMLLSPNTQITPLDTTPYDAFEETPRDELDDATSREKLDDATLQILEAKYMKGGKRRKTRKTRRRKLRKTNKK